MLQTFLRFLDQLGMISEGGECFLTPAAHAELVAFTEAFIGPDAAKSLEAATVNERSQGLTLCEDVGESVRQVVHEQTRMKIDKGL